MIAVAAAGYRALAPDFRGYGLSDPPLEPEKASKADFVNDILGILDVLNIPKVMVVSKDFGVQIAYSFALVYPDRVSGTITLGAPFKPSGPSSGRGFLDLPEGFYIARWNEVGRAEADFGRFDVKTVVKNIYIMFSKSEIPIAAKNQEIMDLVDPNTPLPSWFTEQDLENYASLYCKSGFQTALRVPYRSIGEDLKLPEAKIEVPSLLIMGEKDYALKFPRMENYVRSGYVKTFIPNLEIVYVPEGSHFVQEQFPDKVNELLVNFLGKHT